MKPRPRARKSASAETNVTAGRSTFPRRALCAVASCMDDAGSADAQVALFGLALLIPVCPAHEAALYEAIQLAQYGVSQWG